ncbi:MAG: ABC transporter ATP-binding protein [Burkholderiales bacterium]|nr:ABC transporter ATP-binding protein [Burkholderiales bacterium]
MSDEGSVSRAGLEARLAQPGPIPLAAKLHCAPGEITALLGPSGSGKTTILRAIAGHYLPRSGRIAVGGRLWLDTEAGVNVAAHERRVGLVFQSYALFPHMTALENVAAALGHLPAGARAARARELLETVHLAGLEERRPAELSGGQQQRVAVARALAREPAVLLLDEPFSAVDRSTRERLYRELAEMRRRLAMPVLLVTHDLDEALMLADRVVLLHRGATIQHGAPYEVLARPASVEAARLLGLRNLFEGTVEGERDGFTMLRWRGYLLEARHDPRFPAGARVAWVIPSTRVVLHRRDRPSRGERENPVHGVIREALVLGDMTHATLLVDSDPHAPIQFSVPTHVAQRNRLEEGGAATVSLLAEGIHLMPAAGG